MQIKETLRFYLTPVKMTVINTTRTNAGEDVGGKESLCIVGGNKN
jgi:hypothetical protein